MKRWSGYKEENGEIWKGGKWSEKDDERYEKDSGEDLNRWRIYRYERKGKDEKG